MEDTAKAQAMAAMMMLQSLILALIERGVLTGDDVLSALEDVVEAQRSAGAGGDPVLQEQVLRTVMAAAEEVAAE